MVRHDPPVTRSRVVRTSLLATALACACGRVGFDGSGSGADSDSGTTMTDASANVGYPGVVLVDRPVGYYRLGETAGPTAYDVSGNGRHGTFTGIVFLEQPGAIDGDSDTAARFDGGSWVSVADAFGFEGAASFSVEAWIAVETTNNVAICGKAEYTTDYAGWIFAAHASDTAHLKAWREPSAGFVNGGNLVVGVFAHVVLTYEATSGTFAVYKDGVLGDSRIISQPNDLPAHPGAFRIASADMWAEFVGTIDEVALYEYALPPARIAAHFAAGRNQSTEQ